MKRRTHALLQLVVLGLSCAVAAQALPIGASVDGYVELVRFILGDTGVPYDWQYGDHAGQS